jgi:hypothetical protein
MLAHADIIKIFLVTSSNREANGTSSTPFDLFQNGQHYPGPPLLNPMTGGIDDKIPSQFFSEREVSFGLLL